MFMRTMSLLAVVLGFAYFAHAEEKKAPAFDASKIPGEWKITEGLKSGTKVEGKALEGKITFTKDTITIKDADATHVMTFTIDAKASPVAITMTGKEGPAKDYVAEGILSLDGDTMKLCYAMPMQKRPTAFESKADSGTFYFTLKRQTEAKKETPKK
jgi:uncharacterized protein (TIGR03067 family)